MPSALANQILGIAEGDYQPGYDVPVIYRVTFSIGREDYSRDVETTAIPGTNRKSWAINRAIASVAREIKQPVASLIGRVRRDPVHRLKVTDVSLEPDTDPIPFRNK